MIAYPAATFLRFCHNHGLLQINDRPTMANGGRRRAQVCAQMVAGIADVRLATPVEPVRRLARPASK